MDNKLRNSLIFVMCNYFNCSDSNNFQHPTCILWDTEKCEAAKIIKRIEPLLRAKEENQNSAEILSKEGMSLLEVIKAYPEQVEKAMREHNISLPFTPCPDCGCMGMPVGNQKLYCDECDKEFGENNTSSPKLPELQEVLHAALGGIIMNDEPRINAITKAYEFIAGKIGR